MSMVSSASLNAGGICVHTAYLIQLSAPVNLATPPPTTTIVLYIRFFISSLSEIQAQLGAMGKIVKI